MTFAAHDGGVVATVADALVGRLQSLGVRYVFGLPGSTEGPLLDALSRVDTPEYVLALHENAVVAMADGYARVAGALGVASLHTSVGTGNAVSQIMNAQVDGSPVLAVIGHKDSRLANRDGFCTVEHLPGLLRPYTKWSREVTAPELAVEDIDRASRIALTRPTGPVALTITEDRASAPMPDRGAAPSAVGAALPGGLRPDRAQVQELVRALRAARRPVLIAGDGVTRSGAVELLASMAERFAAPVVQEPRRSAATFNFDSTLTAYCGEYDVAHPAVKDADLVVAVGARVFVEFEPQATSELPEGASLIHLHDDPAELGKRYAAQLALVGTVGATLRDALDLADGPPPDEAAVARLRELRDHHLTDRRARGEAVSEDELTVAAASRVIDELLPDDVVLIDEGVRSSRVLLQHLDLPATRAYHRNTGGAIGWGLPAAVGAAFAAPDRRVVLFVGDGSALMSIQALWTAARYDLPLTVVVSNNRGYQAVQAAVEKTRGEPIAGPAVGADIDQPAPDFVPLARGFGVEAQAVDSCHDLRRALTAALRSRGPRLLELRLATAEHVGGS